MASILLFNCKTRSYNSKLRMVLMKNGIRAVDVPPEAQGQTIEHLLGLADSAPAAEPFTPFEEPMLVMDSFRPGQLDVFLSAMRAARIPPIPLKAMTTPTNLRWTALQLHGELTREHNALTGGAAAVHESE